MNISERQIAILEVLCQKRHETLDSLAETFDVSKSTIRRDVETLSCTYPVKTVRGKYGGGIYLESWYQPNRKYLSTEQVSLLHRLLEPLAGKDRQVMQSILTQFGPGGLL